MAIVSESTTLLMCRTCVQRSAFSKIQFISRKNNNLSVPGLAGQIKKPTDEVKTEHG